MLYCSAILNLSLVALSPSTSKEKKERSVYWGWPKKIRVNRELTEVAKAKKTQQIASFACVNGSEETENWEGPELHRCQSSAADVLALAVPGNIQQVKSCPRCNRFHTNFNKAWGLCACFNRVINSYDSSSHAASLTLLGSYKRAAKLKTGMPACRVRMASSMGPENVPLNLNEASWELDSLTTHLVTSWVHPSSQRSRILTDTPKRTIYC